MRTFPVLALVLLVATLGRRDAGAEPTDTGKEVPYQRALDAAIEVLVDGHLSGSGWIARGDGLALTAAHVVGSGEGRIEVLWNRDRLPATLVARDRGNDLALLRLPTRAEKYPFLALAASMPRPGDRIWLVGTPIYRHGVLLHGTVARAEPTYEWYPKHQVYAAVTHVAATVPRGASGGPWFDAEGNVVALQSGTMTSESVPVGVAFVVPGAALARFMKRDRDAATPTLGAPFEEVWEQSKQVLGRYPEKTEGVVVRKPVDSGPLHRAQVREWQVILAIDDRPVRYRDDLLAHVRSRKPGDRVRLELLLPHGGGRRKLDVELAALE